MRAMRGFGINLTGNKKGAMLLIVTLVSLGIIIVSLALMHYLQTALRAHRAERESTQALFLAQEGVAYALKEIELRGTDWFTHDNELINQGNNNSLAEVRITARDPNNVDPDLPDLHNTAVAGTNYIYNGANDTGYYTTDDARFQVKVYPEASFNDDPAIKRWEKNQVTVILSQATVGQATRTVEYRLGQDSLFKYFYFFPQDHEFDSGTYDGRNFGGIHINGNAILSGVPIFKFLTLFSLGSDTEGKGHFMRRGPLADQPNPMYQFYDSGSYSAEQSFASGPAYEWTQYLPKTLIFGNPLHWDAGRSGSANRPTEFWFGADPSAGPEVIVGLPGAVYEGPEDIWNYDKYAGEADVINHAVHFNISDDNLKDLAQYESFSGNPGNKSLFDNSKHIKISYRDDSGQPQHEKLPEDEAFQTIFSLDLEGRYVDWNSFWSDWKSNHGKDYRGRQFAGLSEPVGDWERTYWAAVFNIADPFDLSDSSLNYAERGINWEWWRDLSYADERVGSADDMFPAQYINPYTGETAYVYTDSYDGSTVTTDPAYYLNTFEQETFWAQWYSDLRTKDPGNLPNDLQEVIRDKLHGGKELNPIRPDVAGYKEDAQQHGIYIGVNGSDFSNPLSETDCIREIQFYNALHPARDGNLYKPSSILEIDVHKLNDWIEANQPNFNGIVYIDLSEFDAVEGGWPFEDYDHNADGILLKNAEVLPEAGLTLVTPNNVYIEGNFNLDPAGDADRFREADDVQVIQMAIDRKDYLNNEEDFRWAPAAVITNRAVYTLSYDFAQPDYYPLYDNIELQFKAENSGYSPGIGLTSEYLGKEDAEWMPPTAVGADADGDGNADLPLISQWFVLMSTADSSGNFPYGFDPATDMPPDGNWNTDWIRGTNDWSGNDWSWGQWDPDDDKSYAFDTDNDGIADEFIYAQQLREELREKVLSCYRSFYQYRDPEDDPTAPEQMLSNPVSEKYIYNVGIATPYDTATYALERWQDGKLTINGAFIQLPSDFKLLPPERVYDPDYIVNSSRYPKYTYETRFGGTDPDRPPGDLLAISQSSWRVTPNAWFSKISSP